MNRIPPLAGVPGLWLALAALAAWLRWSHPLWLLVGLAGLILGVIRPRGAGWIVGAATAAVLAALGAAGWAQLELRAVAQHWPERWEARELQIQDRLADELDALIDRGDRAVDRLVSLAEEGDGPGPAAETLSSLRAETGLDALAVYGPDERPLGWAGSHQGPVPPDVRRGANRYIYGERALFGYLYFTAPLPDEGGVAVGAVLLRAELPPNLGEPPPSFASRFRDRVGGDIRVSRAEMAEGESVWDLRWEDRTLFSVSVLPAGQMEERDSILLRWGRFVLGAVAVAWLLLALGVRRGRAHRLMAGGVLVLAAAVVPLGALLSVPRIFAPADFLLPGPLDLSLGRLLALASAGVVAAGLAGPGPVRDGGRPTLVGVGVVLLGFPVLAALLPRGATPEFLSGAIPDWAAYQAALALLMVLAVVMGFRGLPSSRSLAGGGRWLIAGGGCLLVLTVASAMAIRELSWLPPWMAAAWALPAWFLARGLKGWGRGGLAVAVWGSALAVGVAASLPFAWHDRISARMAVAEERVERLGTPVDPYLEFLLQRFGEESLELERAGRDPVEILYGAWVGSGLAGEGHPVWLTLWSPDDQPQEELRIGPDDPRPRVPPELIEEARIRGETVLRRFQLGDVHYVSASAFPDGRLVTAVVPPRRRLGTAGPLVGLLAEDPVVREPLVLIPLVPGEPPPDTEEVEWVRVEEGWQAELYLTYPDEVYHGHYLIPLSGVLVVMARGTLLFLLNGLLFTLLWGLGALARRKEGPRLGRLAVVIPSFRTRVTVALFLFFLAPTVAFGMLAYRTLAGATVRTAEAIAERSVDDAARWYEGDDADLERLALQVGTDLLLYRDGELRLGSTQEVVELGLFSGWLPPGIHRAMVQGEELMATARWELGGREFVVAYRRLPRAEVLAAPVPVHAGALGLRQRDVADLLGFAVILGAGLSILLALLAGRALSRPIQTLQVASERVGSGNLGVHLPEGRRDEFGAVFSAFNRMVRRLRQARSDLVTTSRRTQAVVEEVASGIVAMDGHGRVALVNRRAEALLGLPLPVGEPLPVEETDGEVRELLRWVHRYFREGLSEARREFQLGDRRIRVRARRIFRRDPVGGAVVSMEDVTDELRSERILAWGEMARQVAHEVKNPLTPIKLGIQHIRRAREDAREDFDEILERNVEAILREIERLASVASSFSRFGAPPAAGEQPLEAVRVERVAREVLALYAAAEGEVRFEYRDGKDGLPPVRAREAELKEVLVNLLENARAALPAGGSVTVEAERTPGGVELRVSDEGIGIPEELLPRIFEPHFSTRSSGTGLGLAIVRRLVESWGASVGVESREGEGTVIRLSLVPWSGDGGDAARRAPRVRPGNGDRQGPEGGDRNEK